LLDKDCAVTKRFDHNNVPPKPLNDLSQVRRSCLEKTLVTAQSLSSQMPADKQRLSSKIREQEIF